MQNFKIIPHYPTYAIDDFGNVKNIKSGKEVPILKRSDKNGMATVSLTVKGKKYKETIQDLLDATIDYFDEYICTDCGWHCEFEQSHIDYGGREKCQYIKQAIRTFIKWLHEY